MRLPSERPERARLCLDAISNQWDATIGRLKVFVEDEGHRRR
jgi:hypothetical protein